MAFSRRFTNRKCSHSTYRAAIARSLSHPAPLPLTDPQDVAETMRRFYQHLEPGGILVLSFMSFWHAGDRLEIPFVLVDEKIREEDGALIRKCWSGKLNPDKQIVERTVERYEVLVNGQVTLTKDHPWPNAARWYSQDQASALFQMAGFKAIQKFDDYPFHPATEQSELCYALGQK